VTRVLITGASGFIGRHLLPLLVSHGHEVHAISHSRAPLLPGMTWHSADLLADGAARSLSDRIRPEWLLHLAWYLEPGAHLESPVNVAWTEASLSLLRAFAAAGGRRAVTAGTAFEYDWSAGVCEERETALRPVTLYGVCKSAFASVAGAAAPALGVSLACARIFWLYGPHEPSGRLVSSLVQGMLAGRPVTVRAGDEVRDFLHVEDVAQALVAVMESDVTGPINIASGDAVPVREVAHRLAAMTQREDLLRFAAEASGEPKLVVAAVDRLTGELGFRPRFDLETGLTATVDWWRSAAQRASR
jgi:nucleoside-diphosphate-sugar epimerase